MLKNSKQPASNNIDNIEVKAVLVIESFLSSIKNKGNYRITSSNTVKNYTSHLNRFKNYINKYQKDLLFTNLNEEILYDFLFGKEKEKKGNLTRGTINTYISILKSLCKYAYENEIVNKNIGYKFKKIKHNYLLPKYFSNDQISSFLQEVNKLRNAYLWSTIFYTLLGTGLRVNELVNLRINDFDLNNKLLFTQGKGNKERYVPIYPIVEKKVLSYLKKTGVKNVETNSSLLFSRCYGEKRIRPISVRSVEYNMTKIRDLLKLDKIYTVHSFRHTFAVNSLKAGMKPEYLSQVLGHSDPSTTYIYTKLLPKDLQVEVNDKFPIPLEKLLEELI